MNDEFKIYSPEDRTIAKILDDKANLHKDKIFLFYDDQQTSYGQLNERANIAANAFLHLGLKEGDKVAVLLENCPEFLYVWFGLAKIGVWIVPVNIGLRGEGLAYIINHCDAETLVVSLSCVENINFIRQELKHIKTIIVDAGSGSHGLEAKIDVILWSDFFQGSKESPGRDIKAEDTMMLVYTAGTTGMPKGVLKAQSYSYNTGLSLARLSQAGAIDRFFTTLPLYHINAQNVTTWTAIAADASTVLTKHFSASRFWSEIRKHHITITSFLGAMIPILLKQPGKEDDGRNPLRIGISAGTPPALWRRFEDRFQLKLLEIYGSSEGGGLQNPNGKVGSMGRPVASYLAKVVDKKDQEVPPFQAGELVFKFVDSTFKMPEYYKMPEATAEKTRGGWLRTGDLAYIDEDGYFYFVDREKDTIRRRGENISSYEVEKVVNSHPDVLESAAVGVPAEMGEDEVKFYVVLKPCRKLAPQKLIEYCEPRMAYFMIPRYVEFLEALPKTTTEKILKKTLKEMGVSENTWDREKAGYQIKR
jgi:crotonobetaine/carnitine-CoA ligase